MNVSGELHAHASSHPRYSPRYADWWVRLSHLKERDQLEEAEVDGRIILKLILQKYSGCGLD